MKFRNALAIVLCMCMFVVSTLTGCGKNQNATEETGNVSGESSGKSGESSKTGNEKTVLEVWTNMGDLSSDPFSLAFQEAVSDFNANNDYNVVLEINNTPGDQYKTKLRTAAATQDMPDIFYTWPERFMEPFISANAVMPLNEYLAADSAWEDSFMGGIFDPLTFDDKIYAVPLQQNILQLFYNKEMFAEYGITPPETWDELVDVINVINANGKIPFAVDMKDTWAVALLAEWITTSIGGADMVERIRETGNWTDPDMIAAGDKLVELRELNPFSPDAALHDYSAARNLFETEEAAMYVMANWDNAYFESSSPILDKIGVAKLATISDKNGTENTMMGSVDSCQAISSTCENPEAAVAFLKYLTSESYQKEVIKERLGYMGSVDVETDPSKIGVLAQATLEIVKDREKTVCYYDTYFGATIGSAYNESVISIFVGNEDSTELYQKIEETAKREISSANQ